MSKTKKKLLFVCLGNICRSPAAESVMRAIVNARGVADDYVIDSAGIGDWHVGQLPDSRMRKFGAERGYRLDSRARQFRDSDFTDFDHIYVMDHENYRTITSRAGNSEERRKVEMLADYLRSYPGTNVVPDPYYGDAHDFNYALDLIEDACESLLEHLQII